jgi:hypothetical protein
LLIITTLPDRFFPKYQLMYAHRSGYNCKHIGKQDDVRRNPFRYWYTYYRKRLEARISNWPIYFANFDGNRLKRVPLWPAFTVRGLR